VTPSGRVPLSVVVPTTDSGPTLHRCVAGLLAQARPIGAEIIVADASARTPPAERPPDVQWIERPGASVFKLRAAGVAAARGEIVALTEDHCIVAPDWCVRLLEAHSRYPSVPCIGGAVENGSKDALIDEANFLLTFSPFLPGTPALAPDRSFGISNVSFKRGALSSHASAAGWIETALLPQLHVQGAVLVDDIRVTHVQSHGFLRTFVVHFHNGRSTSGILAQWLPSGVYRARLRRCPGLPLTLTRQTLRNGWTRQVPRTTVAATAPFVFLLAFCHALGELVGLVAGPGASPTRLV